MPSRERIFVLTVAGQAVAVTYLSLLAFLTATSEREVQVTPAIALLFITISLGWYVTNSCRGAEQPDSARLTVIIPNVALLGMSLANSLPFAPTSSGLPNALVAFAALTMIGASLRLTQARGRSVAPLPADS